MNFIMNLLWDILGGFLCAIIYCVFGILWCCTIIGIPFGVFCFKMAGLVLAPFGKEMVYDGKVSSILLDIIWVLLTGWECCVLHLVLGVLLCITIIGIPFGLQHFKLAFMFLLPFGTHAK